MGTQAKPGIGATFRRAQGSAWDTVAEITAISYKGPSRNVIETFRLDNSDEYVNKLQGVLNAGSVTLTLNYVREEWYTLKTDMETRGNRQYQILLPDGEAIEFEGFVTEMPLDFGSDDVMKGDVAIEIDGKADYVSSGSPTP